LLVLSVAAFAQPKHWVVGFSQIGFSARTASSSCIREAAISFTGGSCRRVKTADDD